MPKRYKKMPKKQWSCYTYNFKTLMQAVKAGHVCLLDIRRRSDGKPVAAICAVNPESDGSAQFTPFAIMVEGNPFDLFDPPNPEGGYRE